MEKYTHAVASCKFCDVEGSKYLLGIPFLKYLCAEVFNNEPGAKEVYEELAATMNSESETIYCTTMNRVTANRILWAAAGLIGDYIAALLRRRFGPEVLSHELWSCQIPAAIYANHLHSLGVECLKLSFDFRVGGTITDEDFESACYDDLWWQSTTERDVDAVISI